MFRISPDKISRNAKKVPNTVSASSRTKPITVSQPSVITKKDMNSNLNGLGLDNTKTRRPQPRSNTKNDRVPSASKSSRSKNKEVKVEEHHRNLLLSKKNKHISSACNNSKIDSQDGRGLQVSQETKDSHVILTPTHSDAQQESSSTSLFMTNLLNPITDPEEPVQTTCQIEEPSHPVFETGAKDQPIIQTTQHPEWFSQRRRPPTPNHDWKKFVPAAQGNAQ
nr:hypothetical protein [Tanacetum cinerariifolium]